MSKLITPHLIKVFLVFRNSPEQWLTVAQAAAKSGINADTTKHHIRALTKEKVLERIDETRPYCYKFSDIPNERTAEIERIAVLALQGDS
jgi:hypothetical protein